MACASAEPPAPTPDAEQPPEGAAVRATAFELAPGVVVSPAEEAVYVARPEGGTEAVQVRSGETLWSSEAAERPLIATGGRLLAQRGRGAGLPLVVLDAADGEALLRIDAPLPQGVHAGFGETLERRFTIAPALLGETAILEWEYLERDALGVSPPGGRAFARRDLGALRVDLLTGRATLEERGGSTTGDSELAPLVARLMTEGELRSPPWRSGELLAATRQLYGPDRLVLRRWRAETGKALPEVVLSEGRPVAVLPSPDRRHLLVVRRRDAEAGGGEPYLWTIHSLASGRQLGERPAERSATPFCLLGATLLFPEPPAGRRVQGEWREEPLALRALDIRSGDELWRRPLRDSAFRGPAPPRPPAPPSPA